MTTEAMYTTTDQLEAHAQLEITITEHPLAEIRVRMDDDGHTRHYDIYPTGRPGA